MWSVFDDEGAAPIEIPKTQRTVSEQVQRKPLPDHLPRDVQTFLPESIGKCSKCGAPMKPLGEDVSGEVQKRLFWRYTGERNRSAVLGRDLRF